MCKVALNKVSHWEVLSENASEGVHLAHTVSLGESRFWIPEVLDQNGILRPEGYSILDRKCILQTHSGLWTTPKLCRLPPLLSSWWALESVRGAKQKLEQLGPVSLGSTLLKHLEIALTSLSVRVHVINTATLKRFALLETFSSENLLHTASNNWENFPFLAKALLDKEPLSSR